jgi:hypothetical protein
MIFSRYIEQLKKKSLRYRGVDVWRYIILHDEMDLLEKCCNWELAICQQTKKDNSLL